MTTQFVPFTCPNCGGDLMLASDLTQATCNYCGKPFLVSRDQAGAGSPSFESLMSLADTAAKAGNGAEAYELYTRALELSPAFYEAWFGKGYSALLLSEPTAPRLEEAETYFREAIRLAPATGQPHVDGLATEALAWAYGTHLLSAVNAFRDLREGWEFLEPHTYDSRWFDPDGMAREYARKLEQDRRIQSARDERLAPWQSLVDFVLPLFAKIDTMLPGVPPTPRFQQMLADLSDACDFLLSNPGLGVTRFTLGDGGPEATVWLTRGKEDVPVRRLSDHIKEWQGRLNTKPLQET